MTTTQSLKIYELLMFYSIKEDEARLIISGIAEALKTNNELELKKNGLASGKLDLLKLQLEKERKSGKRISSMGITILGIIFLLILFKIFIIK